jgi:hypothetical protein
MDPARSPSVYAEFTPLRALATRSFPDTAGRLGAVRAQLARSHRTVGIAPTQDFGTRNHAPGSRAQAELAAAGAAYSGAARSPDRRDCAAAKSGGTFHRIDRQGFDPAHPLVVVGELEGARAALEIRELAGAAGTASRRRSRSIEVTGAANGPHGAAAMVNPLDILPILALALTIVFIPVLSDGAPARRER